MFFFKVDCINPLFLLSFFWGNQTVFVLFKKFSPYRAKQISSKSLIHRGRKFTLNISAN